MKGASAVVWRPWFLALVGGTLALFLGAGVASAEISGGVFDYDPPQHDYDDPVAVAPGLAVDSTLSTAAISLADGGAFSQSLQRLGYIYDSTADLVAPRTGVLVEGAGSGTRTINFRPNAADPNWGLTQRHLNKHLFGSGQHSLSTIDAAGNPALWTDYIQDLAGRPVTKTTSNGMQDIIGTFPLADGSGTFQFGIRIAPNTDGTFDLITLLTRQ